MEIGLSDCTEKGLEAVIDVHKKHRRIEKVPLLLQKNASNSQDYDPRMVSIGPYHHGKVELQDAEKMKPAIADIFISDSGRTRDEYYNALLSKVDYFRSCYAQGSTEMYDDEKFATMILLDGCLVLTAIEYFASEGERSRRYVDEISRLGMHAVNCVTVDAVLLLENQLPFEVLQVILNLKYEGDQGMKMMAAYFVRVFSIYFLGRKVEVDATTIDKIQPLHLIELYNQISVQYVHHLTNYQRKISHKAVLFQMGYFFRSISELKAKGIYISRSPSGISFTSYGFFGLLRLPAFSISPNTRISVSNRIAYELSPGNNNECVTVSLINFWKSLFIHPDDVKELRSKRILLGDQYFSDEQVVNSVQSIATYPVDENHNYVLLDITRRIQKHYDNKAKTCFAELIHKYFSSPWTVIAFLAATCVVTLTFGQTYFTIFPPPSSSPK